MKNKRIHELRKLGYGQVTREEFFELLDIAEGIQNTPAEAELEKTKDALAKLTIENKQNQETIKKYNKEFWHNNAKYADLEHKYESLFQTYKNIVQELANLRSKKWWEFWRKTKGTADV